MTAENQTAGTTEVNETQNAEALAQAKEARHAAIKANFNNQVDVKEFKFHFKKVKDEATGLESKRPTVELSLPIPSFEGIVAILESGNEKQQSLLLEAVQSIVLDRAREIVNEKEDISQDNFPLEQLSWESISNLPKAERRGGGISKETWDEFVKDYIAVMPSVTGKNAEQVGNAAKILLNKFQAVKTNKPVISLLKTQIGIYINNTPNAEAFQECYEFLVNKADTLLAADEAALLANL